MFSVKASGFDKPVAPELVQYIQTLPDTLEEEALAMAVEFESELAEIYPTAPPRGSGKFIWSTNPTKQKKAARYYFGAIKRGAIKTVNGHYDRQGKPPYGAAVRVERNANGVLIIFAQEWDKSGMVFGQLNGKDTRLPGHKETGWDFAFTKFNSKRNVFLRTLFDRVLSRRASEGRL